VDDKDETVGKEVISNKEREGKERRSGFAIRTNDERGKPTDRYERTLVNRAANNSSVAEIE
jgi:hypothetical protein